MHLKKYLTIIICLFVTAQFSLADHKIEAEKNAYRHNNMGLMYLKEKYYFGAIKEFQIAIDLAPNTQAAATYYTNLGKTYETIGYYNLARPCFEKALSINFLYFDNYLKLAENYKNLNIIDEKIEEFQNKKDSPLSQIMVGLLYIQKGHKSTGITILDDFCNKEENLLITTGVKNYIKKISQ